MRFLIINGPNLNLLGKREPAVYGTKTLEDLENILREEAEREHWFLDFFQSNHEGSLIDRLQKAGDSDGIVLNAGGYTHTSIALRDTIASLSLPVIEVHISNIYGREEFRRESVLSAVCQGVIAGLGFEGYSLALRYLANRTAALRPDSLLSKK
ncbi:MAG: type II 3-dehydroquinate dehydratase [Candidatus Ozemobacteraceae bacterium]